MPPKKTLSEDDAMLVRMLALACAAVSVAGTSNMNAPTIVSRAKKFEEYING